MLPMLLQLVLISTAATASSAAADSLARPGCQSECGDITVPYPFGFGSGCYMEGFQLYCFNSRLFFNVQLEIIDIDLSGHKARVYTEMFSNCDRGADNQTPAEDSTPNSGLPIDLTGTPYTLSHTDNKFTAIGCSIIVYFNATKSSDDYPESVEAGCISVCYPKTNNTISATFNGDCSGAGCCQTTIPAGINYFTATSFSPMANSENSIRTRTNPCSYAFLAENNWYKFNESDLYGLNFSSRTEGQQIPAVLNWSMGDVECDKAKINRSSYACKSTNSECDDRGPREGYICRCKPGYAGNPYLENGCQDMCSDVKLSGCYGACIDQKGHKGCTCGDGKPGNPFVPGGCISEPPSNRTSKLSDLPKNNYFPSIFSVLLVPTSRIRISCGHGFGSKTTRNHTRSKFLSSFVILIGLFLLSSLILNSHTNKHQLNIFS